MAVYNSLAPGLKCLKAHEKYTMEVEELFETPQTIQDLDNPTELDLVDKDKNRALYEAYSGPAYRYKKEVLKLTDAATIYQHKTEFFCLDTDLKKVTYYMRYKVGTHKKLGQYVWQSMVWVSPRVQARYMNGIARKIFFDFLLSKFHTILTDSEQTWKGQRFWEISIGAALDQSLKVFYFDFATQQVIPFTDNDDLSDFQKKYDIWGNSKTHALRRMIIADHNIEN